VVVDMGAELAAGAVQLFDQELWYAGAAFVLRVLEPVLDGLLLKHEARRYAAAS